MPIFSYTASSVQVTNSQGKFIHTAPPHEVLETVGPRMPIVVTPSKELAQALEKQGAKIKQDEVEGLALIDTGATNTVIDNKLASVLGLPTIDRVKISTPSNTEHIADVYSGVTTYIKGTGAQINIPRVIGGVLQNQGIQMLIGRDILSMGILIYSGHAGSFSFSL